MNTQLWLVSILVLGLLGFGTYFFLNGRDSHSMAPEAMTHESEVPAVRDSTLTESEGPTSTASETMAKHDDAMMEKSGTYEAYSPEKLALAESGKVVLFFHAAWCPICLAMEKDINAHLSAIPAGTHILKVDYDSSDALKRQYGVTYQHTFVQVDAKGNKVAKWGDVNTLAALVAKLK